MLVLILVLALLALPNALLARRQQRSPMLWGFLSIVGFFIAYFLLGGTYFAIMYKGAMTQEAVTAWVLERPLMAFMMMLLGVAGVLAVRFILERTAKSK